jgi:hypothetical protein
MPKAPLLPIATLGIDIGKNSFHLIGLDGRGAIVLRQKLSRGQVEQRLANMPTCLSAWRRVWGLTISAVRCWPSATT